VHHDRVRIVEFLLSLAHTGTGALWLGSMAYSLFVVQPRLARLLSDPERVEDVYRELAAGNRWRVAGLIGVLGTTGLGLVAVVTGRSGLWWAGVAVKGLLWTAAAGLFWWVSWRGWPRRVFALPAELPALQRRFRRVALGLLGLVATAFVVGIGLRYLPRA
jgi:Flp pilus assembly protein TadB